MVNANAAVVLQRRCLYRQGLALVAVEQMLNDPQAVLDEAFYDQLESHFKALQKYTEMSDNIRGRVAALKEEQAPPAPEPTERSRAPPAPAPTPARRSL